MGLSILGSDCPGRGAPVLVTSGAVSVALLVSTGDPFDLTGLEVRAHGKGKDAHESVSVALEFYRVTVRGSIPQPGEQLTAVDPLPFHVPIVCQKLRGEGVDLCCLGGNVPGDGVVGRMGAIPKDVGKGGARGVEGEQFGRGHESVSVA